MTGILIGLAILWAAPIVVSVAMVVRVIREDRAERREFEREVRFVLTDEHRDRPPNPVAPGQRFDPRVHGRADHLRI
jgi:hypothetical protein